MISFKFLCEFFINLFFYFFYFKVSTSTSGNIGSFVKPTPEASFLDPQESFAVVRVNQILKLNYISLRALLKI